MKLSKIELIGWGIIMLFMVVLIINLLTANPFLFSEPEIVDVDLQFEPIPVEETIVEEVEEDFTENIVTVRTRDDEVIKELLEIEGEMYDDPDIPNEFEIPAQIYGKECGICPEFIEAACFYESSFTEDVKNRNCWGCMQINVKIHADLIESLGYTKEDMLSASPCIHVACSLLSSLFEKYEDPAMVLMVYNGDSSGINRYKTTGKISRYANKILIYSEELERNHGK